MNTRHIAHSYRERWKLKTDSFKENSKPLRPRIYRQIQENVKQQIIETKDSELEKNQHTMATKQHAIEAKERQLQQTQLMLLHCQQLVEQFQQSLQHKDKTISDLQQTISHYQREREIQQLQQDIASSIQTAEKHKWLQQNQ